MSAVTLRAEEDETMATSEKARKRAQEWLEECARIMGPGPVVILPEVKESLAELLDEWEYKPPTNPPPDLGIEWNQGYDESDED